MHHWLSSADKSRILMRLRRGDGVTAIAQGMGVAQATISKIASKHGIETVKHYGERMAQGLDTYAVARGSRWQRDCAAVTFNLAGVFDL